MSMTSADLEYWGTRNSDMKATKEVVTQKIMAARDLIKCHPFTSELATGLFTSKDMGVCRFSSALIEWSESDLNDMKRLCVQAYNRETIVRLSLQEHLAHATINIKCPLYLSESTRR